MQNRRTNALASFLMAGVLAISTAGPAMAQAKQPEGAAAGMPKVGEMAPDFTLKYFDGNDEKEISLSQYRGKKNVVLGFFIFAFTGG